MCGFLGYASKSPIPNLDKLLLKVNQISHRGPDSKGYWTSTDMSLGFSHQRLSIVDLSENGSQPMSYAKDTLTIVFNGEIYNYRELYKELKLKGYKFNSFTDTEVILASYQEWGYECVDYFNGMFSFAIYDSVANILFISRDRTGEKPLYYQFRNGVLSFASELKAILLDKPHENKINKESLDCYLSMGFVPGERCIAKNFKKLPAAHYLIFNINDNSFEVKKYWNLPNYSGGSESKNSLTDDLEKLLENSVKRQLEADVPVGVLLSGGLDSSIITGFASRYVKNIKTFNVRFPNEHRFDETIHARKIAKHFDTDHIELEAKPVDVDMLMKIVKQFDEPIIDTSIIPSFMLSKLVKQHCTVAIGGDGGDELFGGYEHYSRLLTVHKMKKFIPLHLEKLISSASDKFLPIGFKGKNWLSVLGSDFENQLPLVSQYFDSSARKKLMQNSTLNWPTVAEDTYDSNFFGDNLDFIQRLTRADFHNYLQEDILVKVDRTSMLNSLEIRAPFLDKDLIEFAFKKVPSNLKTNQRNKKILLKNLGLRILPINFDYSRKQGFSIPINEWLKKGKLRDFFNDVLLDPDAFFERHTIDRLFKYQDLGFNNGERLFGLLMFELWKREYKVSL